MATLISNPKVWERAAREADFTLKLPGGVPLFFRRIPAGGFRMGSRGYPENEEPLQRVVISHEFLLSTFVVTQEQYGAVASRCVRLKQRPDPSEFKGPRRPVENVSWEDAMGFCQWLARWKGLSPEITEVRLPDEAEWEYACRAGAETEYYNGDGEAALADIAWYAENSGNETHPVDERLELHQFGLCGMHGNVLEWCLDVYDRRAYRKRPDGWEARAWTQADAGDDAEYLFDSDRAQQTAARVLRGGSWYAPARCCRSASRNWFRPDDRYRSFGFRVCLVRGPAAQPGRTTEPASGDGGRGTRPESDGAGGAAAAAPDLRQATFPRVVGRKTARKPKAR